MAQPTIQASFNTGEWAPTLNARVDLTKYHSAAALLENFFVDYRGGASTRPGTKYILQAYKSSTAVRLIPFQASFTVGYALEFGDQYIRFYNNGAPVLETALNITGITRANPAVVSVTNTYNAGDVDWIYITGVSGMTQLNGRYFKVHAQTGGTVSLYDLFGNPVDSSAYGIWTAGGTTARVYTISSPYAAADLAKIKFAQNVNALYLCHPNYKPYILTNISATNWTLIPIVIGSTVPPPTGVTAATTLAAGLVYYSYTVTSVDINGQESSVATPSGLALKQDLRTVAGSNSISWTAAQGATSYNVYKAELSYSGAIVAGATYGFIGNCTGVSFVDSNIAPDYATTPPIVQNPFQGAGVATITVTAPGAYTTVPTAVADAAPSGGSTASVAPVLQVLTATLGSGGAGGNLVGDAIQFINGVTLIVATVNGLGQITGFQPITYPGSNAGAITSGVTPANPVTSIANALISANFTWGVGLVQIISAGAGYATAPAITFSAGAAAATTTLATTLSGNPSVVAFFQQRLVFASPTIAPQTFYMSQPGSYNNFNYSNPIQADDSITASLVSGQLNEIQSMLSQPAGLLILTSKSSWVVNGGSAGSAISPSGIVANAQSFNGASGIPPIVSNYDVLFVQAKGSIVRDSTYNFYANVFTGTDITVLSSHLFYGYQITEWAWAEEPFKVVWAVRNDGTMLTLTFLKEQEFVGWSHSVTAGLFKSVTTVTESAGGESVDAVYTVVQRVISGHTVQYIERFAERIFPNGVVDAWCVDAGLQYSGAPATSFTGGEHLAGATVTGLADGLVITPFVMPASGAFTLGTPASKVTVGLAFTAKLQTLAIDLGEPTVQSKVKKIPGVTVRVAETLGLQIGQDFNHLTPMKDLVVGQVSGMLTGQQSQTVTDLVTGDAYTLIGPAYTVPGQYCIQQSNPFPASILGVIPEIVVGDTAK